MKPHARVGRMLTATALLVGLTAIAPASLAPAQATVSAQAAIPAGGYVALGDSYSAGSAILPLAATAPLLCAQSALNYPHLLAQRTGRALTDVTCGNAETKHFYTSQYLGVAPQLNALSSSTALVTIGIGGNDSGVFLDAIVSCGTLGSLTLGLGSPCKNTYGTKFTDTINTTTLPALTKAIAAVKARAPQATIAVVGYPRILPATGGCFGLMPIAAGDVPYLNNIELTLNSAVSRAAAANGVTYVDMWGPSAGRDSCQAPWVRWVEPMFWGLNLAPIHPNAAGERAMANQVAAALGL